MNSALVWLGKNCVRHPRISGGVVVLLRYLNAWLSNQRQHECSLAEFESILKDKGLHIVIVSGTLLVPGMGLAEDWNQFRRAK
jgi:hypothetical protein